MKKILILLISSISLAMGQTISPDNRIVVLGEATIEIPADKVIFNIRLGFRDSSKVETAFNKHKEAEAKLLSYLKEQKIPNKNIQYTLVSIGQEYNYLPNNKREIVYTTSQNVTVTLDDIKEYAPFMIKLIKAGFNEVNTSFTSSKDKDFHDKLITKAVEAAEKKANVMAKAANRKLDGVLKVMDTEETDPVLGYHETVRYGGMMKAEMADSAGMAEIPQSIIKSMKVKVVFGLK